MQKAEMWSNIVRLKMLISESRYNRNEAIALLFLMKYSESEKIYNINNLGKVINQNLK